MSDRLQRILIWVLAVALTVGTGVALRFAGGYRQIAGFSAPPPMPADVTLRLMHVRGIGRQHNRVAWSLSADRVDTTRDRTRIDFVGNIALNLFSEGAERGSLTSQNATYLALNKTLLINGKVVGLLRDPIRKGVPGSAAPPQSLRVETEQVQWNIGTRQIFCPGAVSLTMKDGKVTGNQLTVDLTTHDHSMHNIQAEFDLGEGAAPPNPLSNLLPTRP